MSALRMTAASAERATATKEGRARRRDIHVAVVHRRLAHYRLPLYEGLVRSHPDIQLTVYCGSDGDDAGRSGMSINGDPDFVRRVKSYTVRSKRTELLVQPGTVWQLVRRPPDVAVFEGRVLLVSSVPVMLWRRLTGRKNIIWLKGWPNAVGEGRLSRLVRSAYLKLGQRYIVYGHASIPRLQHYGVRAEQITVAQNTVDVSALLEPAPSVSKKAEHPAVEKLLDGTSDFLLNIGRLVRQKAVADLLEAYAAIRGEPAFANVQLAIVGGGPDAERLHALVRDRGLQESVVFTGKISDADAELLFRSARGCVFPGAVGLALNQALAAGRPVICADESGPDSELLRHEQNGLRYPKGDVRALAAAIRNILRNQDLAHSLGERARESIRQSATMQNMIDSYAQALRRVIT